MIVFDLCCQDAGHRFEAWFRSSADYDRQKRGGLLMCPQCGSEDVDKAVMAPAVGRKGNRADSSAASQSHRPDAEAGPPPAPSATLPAKRDGATILSNEAKAALVQLVSLQKEIVAKSRWVGRSFAEEARAIHYGEKDAEPIYGEASPEEGRDLAEEGIGVAPLLFPVAPPDEVN